MGKLIFKAADLKRVVEHALANPAKGKKPEILLVHDQGVYMMSGGSPRDIIEGDQKNGHSYCAYAQGCNPKVDKDTWYDTAHDLVGGDDFGEHLKWAEQIKGWLDDGASEIVVGVSASRLSLTPKFPKGKEPKGETREATAFDHLKHWKRVMKKKVLALDPKRDTLQQFHCLPLPDLIARIKKQQPTYRILNDMPEADLMQLALARAAKRTEGAKAS